MEEEKNRDVYDYEQTIYENVKWKLKKEIWCLSSLTLAAKQHPYYLICIQLISFLC